MIKNNKNKAQMLIQIIKFGVVGFSNTAIYLLCYYILLFCKTNYLFATVIGYLVSSLSGYMINKLWVFQAKEKSIKKSIVRYYVVYGLSLLINIWLAYLWVDILKISAYISPLLSMCITIPFNFFLSKFWVYR